MRKRSGTSWKCFSGLLAFALIACAGADRGPLGPQGAIPRPGADRQDPVAAEPGQDQDADPEQAAVDERLASSAASGHWLDVLAAMDDGADVESLVGVAGITALHVACLDGGLERAELLVEQGADVSAVTERNETPLHLAALSGSADVLTFLVDQGAYMAAVDHDDRSVLHWAILGGWLKTVEYLVSVKGMSATFDPGGVYPPLVASIQSGNLETVKFLVTKGAGAALADADGITPLHHAAAGNELEIATFLVSKGAKAAARDDAGKTSLHALAMGCADADGCLVLAKFLVKKGAKKGSVDADGKTASDYAVERGDEEMSSFLSGGK